MFRILLVDDDKEFLESAQAVLEEGGYEVVTASCVEEAETKLNDCKPDAIFLDIMMKVPDDGIAFAHKLRKQGVKIPIVIVSAVSKVTGFEYGKCDEEVLPCDSFLEKPVTAQALLAKAKELFEKTKKE